MSGQIKSRSRVAAFGEVYTAKKQVWDMLRLVPDTLPIDATWLEPACGNGNFLAEILKRKLIQAGNETDYVRAVIIAVSSIYGVDIQHDNVIESRDRLLQIITNDVEAATKSAPDPRLIYTAKQILSRNIVCGNTLSETASDGSPLIFCEWKLQQSGCIICKEYRYSDLLSAGGACESYIARHRYNWLKVNKIKAA